MLKESFSFLRGFFYFAPTCYYPKSGIVAVEVKNVSARFGAHPKHQLERYADMVANGVLKRVEYIFSNKSVAELNEEIIQRAFDGLSPAKYKIYFIDDFGQIQKL